MEFQVYGDYALTSEQLLNEFKTEKEAVQWVDKFTIGNDLGKFETVEVMRFWTDGESASIYIKRANDE